jgi:hypothetical protein
MMMVRSRGIIGLSDYRGGRDIWSRVRLGSIACRGVLAGRKARPRAYGSRIEAGRRLRDAWRSEGDMVLRG